MARDGSGTYTRVEGPYVNGVVADADEMNNELDDISDAITDSINSSGTKAMGANWSMGGFRLTDLAAPSSANDAARKAYVDSAITAAAQPLDATLTALAALSWSSGNPLVQFMAGIRCIAYAERDRVCNNRTPLPRPEAFSSAKLVFSRMRCAFRAARRHLRGPTIRTVAVCICQITRAANDGRAFARVKRCAC